jgi:hypothetical protein
MTVEDEIRQVSEQFSEGLSNFILPMYRIAR